VAICTVSDGKGSAGGGTLEDRRKAGVGWGHPISFFCDVFGAFPDWRRTATCAGSPVRAHGPSGPRSKTLSFLWTNATLREACCQSGLGHRTRGGRQANDQSEAALLTAFDYNRDQILEVASKVQG
jgi:hypothetical protein